MFLFSQTNADRYREIGGVASEGDGVTVLAPIPAPAEKWSYYKFSDGRIIRGSDATPYTGESNYVGIDRENGVELLYGVASVGDSFTLIPCTIGDTEERCREVIAEVRAVRRAPVRSVITITEECAVQLGLSPDCRSVVVAANGIHEAHRGEWIGDEYGTDVRVVYDAATGAEVLRCFQLPRNVWVCDDCGRCFQGESINHLCRACAVRRGYTGSRCECGGWAQGGPQCARCEEREIGPTSADNERSPEMTFPRLRRGVRLLGVGLPAVVGVEMETTYRDARLRELYSRVKWKIGHKRDGSINPSRSREDDLEEGDTHGGLEFVTAPLHNDLEKIITVWSDTLRGGTAGRWSANSSCGLHFHLDARRASPLRVARMVWLWWKFEENLLRLQPKSRNSALGSGDAGRYCKRIDHSERSFDLLSEICDDADLAETRLAPWWYRGLGVSQMSHLAEVTTSDARNSWGVDRYSSVRYSTINLCSFYCNKKKTIEIRAGAGTTRKERILPWVALGSRLWALAGEESYRQATWADVIAEGELKSYAAGRELELYGSVS